MVYVHESANRSSRSSFPLSSSPPLPPPPVVPMLSPPEPSSPSICVPSDRVPFRGRDVLVCLLALYSLSPLTLFPWTSGSLLKSLTVLRAGSTFAFAKAFYVRNNEKRSYAKYHKYDTKGNTYRDLSYPECSPGVLVARAPAPEGKQGESHGPYVNVWDIERHTWPQKGEKATYFKAGDERR